MIVGGQRHAPATFTPRKDPVSIAKNTYMDVFTNNFSIPFYS